MKTIKLLALLAIAATISSCSNSLSSGDPLDRPDDSTRNGEMYNGF